MIAFLVILFGYQLQSSVLQLLFYTWRGKDKAAWKVQPGKGNTGVFWGHPLLSAKHGRAPYHRAITSFNLLMASSFAGACSELAIRGSIMGLRSSIRFTNASVGQFCVELCAAILWESVLEYYWHRLMHVPLFYSRFHKLHHHYKSPEVWDDLYIHPLEAFGYYLILYSPTVIIPIHVVSFIGYMIIMGLCGVMDHSGIKMKIPYIYNSVDHDLHHKYTKINYGFPFPFMDILMNTYYRE